MEPEKMLKIGGYAGIVLAILTISGLLVYSIYILPPLMEENVGALTASLIIIAGISIILTGPSYVLFGLGFQGGAKKFGKGIGTGAFVMALLAGIFIMITGFGVIGLLAALAAESLEAALAALLILGIGILLYALFVFIFNILAIIYFFSTEQGTLGGVGGILLLIGQLISLGVGIGYIITLIGLILMGICLLKQSKL
ncbi:MAG: hypothetical protein NDP13_05565 [Crenarchaeota archaeon]|nr:hypothetical protein [Thermoproteota archaeon]MCR8501565.1 hypothetical protein [Thermoproteota archaeon]